MIKVTIEKVSNGYILYEEGEPINGKLYDIDRIKVFESFTSLHNYLLDSFEIEE